MKQVQPDVESFARIRVIGVGGSGNNAINHMINSKVKGVEFIAVNTDAQDLHHSQAKKKIHIGKNLTKGLGAGMDPDLGKRAAGETKEEIQEAVKGSDMVFITCGYGGGTGTGAGAVIARTARELGALTVAIVTKPFSFEGQHRMTIAEQGLENLKSEVDALVIIPNDRLLAIVDKDTSVKNAFAMSDDILLQAVEGISDLITTPGVINVDFADIRAIMENTGSALMGIGIAGGEKRAEEAAQMAISSPLLEVSINGAKGVLFAVAGGDDLGMLEIQDAAKVITESIDPNAKVIFGTIKDNSIKKNEVKVTVIATGFPDSILHKSQPLFHVGSTPANDQKVKDTDEEKVKGKIFNTINASSSTPKTSTEKVSRPTTNINIPATPAKPKTPDEENRKKDGDDDDDDSWGVVPAFLRRSKIK